MAQQTPAVRQTAFIVAVLFVLSLAGCGGDNEKSAGTTTVTTTVATTTNQSGTASVTTHGKYKYPPVVINNFMKSCQNGMSNRGAYCACTLDKLSNEVSVQDFARIGLAGGKLPPRIRSVIEEASIDCADKL